MTSPAVLDRARVTQATMDRELVARCLSGDVQAERALYDAHVDRVYRLAYRMTGDGDLASDFTQETFIRAFARLEQYRGPRRLVRRLGRRRGGRHRSHRARFRNRRFGQAAGVVLRRRRRQADLRTREPVRARRVCVIARPHRRLR